MASADKFTSNTCIKRLAAILLDYMKCFITLISGLLGVTAFGQVTISPAPTPVPTIAQPWPMDHGNAARTGQSFFPGPSQGQIAWSKKLAGGIFSLACNRQGQAILGVLFHTSWWSNEMFAQTYNADGSIAWRIKVPPYPWGAAQGVRSAPALDRDGNVVLNSSNGQILKISPTGDILTTIQRTANFTNDSAPALFANGDIVQHQALTLAKFTPSGQQIWSTSASSQTDVAVSPNGDCALGGVRTNEPHGSVDLAYYLANGTRLWTFSSTNGARTQPCFGPDGILYATRGGTAAYYPNGTVKWIASPGGFGCSLDGLGHVLVPLSNQVHAFSQATGANVWSVTLPNQFGNVVQGLTIDGMNNIYVATTDGWLYGLRGLNGSRFLNLKVGATCTTQPAIGADSSIYLGVTQAISTYVFENYLVKVN